MMDVKYTVDITKFGKRDCPECGHSIPRSADRCPECGHVFAPLVKCPQWVGWVLVGLFVWLVVWFMAH